MHARARTGAHAHTDTHSVTGSFSAKVTTSSFDRRKVVGACEQMEWTGGLIKKSILIFSARSIPTALTSWSR